MTVNETQATMMNGVMEQVKRYLVFAAFVGLSAGTRIFQHNARTLKYNFLCPIILVGLMKFLSSLVLYLVYDKGSLRDLPSLLRSDSSVVLRYSAVAAAFMVYDVLSFVNLMHFDPTFYLVFLQLRTVGTGVVWEYAFGKSLQNVQRFALVLICGGCMVKQYIGKGGIHGHVFTETPPYLYLLLVLQVVSNIGAGVANEMLLKEKGAVPLNLQNAIQYTWVVFWCLLAGVLVPIEGIQFNPLDSKEWLVMMDMRMVPSIVILTLLGLVTAVMLKLFDAVWKAIATAIELFLTAGAAALVFGYVITLGDIMALSLVVVGVGLYAQPQNPFVKDGLKDTSTPLPGPYGSTTGPQKS